jgi:hypothetical protein
VQNQINRRGAENAEEGKTGNVFGGLEKRVAMQTADFLFGHCGFSPRPLRICGEKS